MARRNRQHSGTAGKTVETIVIPADVQRELDALPDRKARWEPWKDVALRKHYHTKGIRALASILHSTTDTVHRRARELGIAE